jgi:hypothetical protein
VSVAPTRGYDDRERGITEKASGGGNQSSFDPATRATGETAPAPRMVSMPSARVVSDTSAPRYVEPITTPATTPEIEVRQSSNRPVFESTYRESSAVVQSELRTPPPVAVQKLTSERI